MPEVRTTRRIPLLGSAWRIARLTGVEIDKLFAHKFLPFTLVVTLIVTTGLGLAGKHFTEGELSSTRFSNYTLWVAASTYGLRVGIILLVALGAMAVSSEATVRTLNTVLTRPVRRAEFLAAKALSLVFATVLVVAASALSGFVVGGTLDDPTVQRFTTDDEGHVVAAKRPWWRPSYGSVRHPRYPDDPPIAGMGEVMGSLLLGFALLCVPILAASSLGFVIGTLVDSSGLAIGIAVASFVTLETTKFFPFFEEHLGRYLYNYPLSAIGSLMGGAGQGSLPVWDDALAGVLVSGIYVGACFLIALVAFCRRDVTL